MEYLRPIRSEILNDDYVDSLKLKIKSTTSNGVVYSVQAEQDKDDAPIDGKFTHEVVTKGTKATTTFYTSGKMINELKVSDRLGVKGLTVKTRAEVRPSESGIDQKLGANIDFIHGPLAMTLAGDNARRAVPFSMAMAAYPKQLTGYCVAAIAGELQFDESYRDKTSFALSYFDGRESECTLRVGPRSNTAEVSYSHNVRPGLSVAGLIEFDNVKDKTNMVFGGEGRLDGATVVKAKLRSDGQVGLSYIQDVRDRTQLILSTKFDVTTLDSAKIGISLALE